MPTRPTKPVLWAKAKKDARATSEGSLPGRWSARKAARAQLEYKKRGGEWEKTSGPRESRLDEGSMS